MIGRTELKGRIRRGRKMKKIKTQGRKRGNDYGTKKGELGGH